MNNDLKPSLSQIFGTSFLKYLEDGIDAGKEEGLSTYPCCYQEIAYVWAMLISKIPDCVHKTPSHEYHFATLQENGAYFTSVIQFGDVREKRMAAKDVSYMINPKHVIDCKLNVCFPWSLSTFSVQFGDFGDGIKRILIRRIFGEPEPVSNRDESTMFYLDVPHEALHIVKCNIRTKTRISYWVLLRRFFLFSEIRIKDIDFPVLGLPEKVSPSRKILDVPPIEISSYAMALFKKPEFQLNSEVLLENPMTPKVLFEELLKDSEFQMGIFNIGIDPDNFKNIMNMFSQEMAEVWCKTSDKILYEGAGAVSSIAATIKDTFGAAFVIMTVCYGIDYFVNQQSSSRNKALAMGVIAAGIYGPRLLATFSERLARTECASDEYSFQMGDSSYIEEMFGTILSCLPNFNMKMLKDYSYFVINFERLREGTFAILNWLLEQIDKLCLWLVNKKVVPERWFLKTNRNAEVLAFRNRMEAFNDELIAGKYPHSTVSFSIVTELLTECISMKLEVSKNSGDASVLESCYKELTVIKNGFGSVNPSVSGMRPEPVAILFRGAPKIWKSTLVDYIVRRLYSIDRRAEPDPDLFLRTRKGNDRREPRDESSSFVFYRKTANKYADGYKNQDVWVHDEFGMEKDVAGVTDNCFTEFIGAKNTMPYHLHMADINDKKNVYFKSKYYIATTNAEEFITDSIIDSYAVNRRWDIDALVSPKQEYCLVPEDPVWKRQFDISKLPNRDGLIDIDPSYFDIMLRKKDIHRVWHNLGLVTFERLFEDILASKLFYERIHNNNMSNADKWAKKSFVGNFPGDSVKAQFEKIWQNIEGTNSNFDGISMSSMRSNNFEDLPENEGIFQFMSELVYTAGSYWGDVLELFEKLVKELREEFLYDVMQGKNTKHWLSKALPLVKRIPDNVNESVHKLNEEFSPDGVSKSVVDHFMGHRAMYSAISLTIMGLLTAYTMWSEKEKPEHQSAGMLRKSDAHKALSLKMMKEMSGATMQMNNSFDKACDDELSSVLHRNTMTFCVAGAPRGTILFIKGSLAILNYHFLEQFADWVEDPDVDISVDTIVDLNVNRKMHADFSHFKVSIGDILSGILEFEEGIDSDLAFVVFPDRIRCRDISHFFKEENTFKDVYNVVKSGQIINFDGEVRYIEKPGMAYVAKDHSLLWRGCPRLLKHCYAMRGDNVVSNCGAVLMEMNRKVVPKIIGIHSSGVPKQQMCIFVRITKEMVLGAIAKACEDRIVLHDVILEDAEHQMDKDVLDDRFVFIKKITPVTTVSKSTWQSSKLAGLWNENTMLPSILHPIKIDGITRDVHKESLVKYNRRTGVYLSSSYINDLIDSEIDWFHSASIFHVDPRVLTREEAIIGISDEIDFGHLSRRTSPGYPYVLNRKGTKGKSMWFGDDVEYSFTSVACQEWFEHCDKLELDMLEGYIPEFPYLDNLKDELRPIEKVIAGKTRNFSASNMDLTYFKRKYFGSWMIFIVKNRLYNGIGIGINPYSEEWNIVVNFLHSKGQRINAGDFASFDADHAPVIDESLLRLVEHFYHNSTEHDRTIRRILWSTVYKSFHVYKDNLYEWSAGLSSGDVLTAILNSLNNRFAHKHCFYILCGKDVDLLWKFNTDVYLITYGDDSLMSTKEHFDHLYNEMTLPVAMQTIGLVYTPETKTLEQLAPRNIFQVEFLKRSFRLEPIVGRFVAPLRLSRITEMVNWTRKDNGDVIMIDKCQIIAYELALHGRSVCVPLLQQLNDRLFRVYGVRLKCSTYNRLLCEVLNCDLGPAITAFQMNIMTVQPMKNKIREIMTCDFGHELLKVKNQKCEFQMDTVINATQETKSLIQDLEEAGMVSSVASKPKEILQRTFDSDFVNNKSDIIRYMEKPVVVVKGSLNTSDNATTFATYPWYTPAISSMMTQKLLGVYTFKATLVLRLDVNAMKMHQGLYILSYLPYCGITWATQPASNHELLHRFSLVQATQLPHVTIDINKDTSAVLRVPWKSCYNSYVVDSTQGGLTNPGAFRLQPYSPLKVGTGGSSACGFVLWGYYEDIVLGTVTYPQMDVRIDRSKGRKDMLHEEQEGIKPSKVLAIASGIAEKGSKIPLLSTLATPVANILDVGSKLALAFGFSKPHWVSQPNNVVRQQFPNLGVVDEGDSSTPLAVIAGNHVSVSPEVFGTALDEMSYDFIKGIQTHYKKLTWSASDAGATIYAAYLVSPLVFGHQTYTDGAISLENYSPMGILARIHNYWRGSIVLNIKVVKTPFHTGRLLFTFEPYISGKSAKVTGASVIENSSYVYRTILDAREETEVELTIPFICYQEWLTRDANTGTFSVIVLDPLVAPSAVSSTCDIIIEAKGGCDMEFASPSFLDIVPCLPSAFQMDATLVATSNTIGNAVSCVDGSFAQEACQGEAITSFRQLIKRFAPTAMAYTGGTVANRYLIAPFTAWYYRSTAAATTPTVDKVTRDLYGMIQSFYGMSRGGVRIAFVPASVVAANTVHIFANKVTSGAGALSTWMTVSARSAIDIAYDAGGLAYTWQATTTLNPVFLPQSTTRVARTVGYESIFDNTSVTYQDPMTNDNTQWYFNQQGTSPPQGVIFRAGGDDASFGCFLSVPPFLVDVAP